MLLPEKSMDVISSMEIYKAPDQTALLLYFTKKNMHTHGKFIFYLYICQVYSRCMQNCCNKIDFQTRERPL